MSEVYKKTCKSLNRVYSSLNSYFYDGNRN